MKTTMFLFGAGAEVDFKMPTGNAFAKILLQTKKNNNLKSIYQENIGTSPLVTKNSVTVYAQTIVEYQNLINEDWLTAYDISKKDLILLAETAYKKDYNNQDWKNNRLCWKNFLDKLKNNIQKLLDDADTELSATTRPNDPLATFVLDHAKFCESLDSKFNALRFCGSEVLKQKARRVINAYCNIHYKLACNMSHTCNFKNGEEYLLFLKSQANSTQCQHDHTSYYGQIFDAKKGQPWFFATTNYTPFSEQYFGKECVTYLNGKMTWFEDYRTLQIFDIVEEDNYHQLLSNDKKIRSNLFPFIFIQSGVKPIVASRQIKQYYEFINRLEKSQILVVLGYGFNNDDNHINAIIGEWLRGDASRKLIFFDWKKDISDSQSYFDKQRFAWCNNTTVCKVPESTSIDLSATICDAMSSSQIYDIFVSENTSRKMLSDVLELLKR